MTKLHRRAFIAGAAAVPFAKTGHAMQPLYVPPEEARHQRTLMMWPASRRVYRDADHLYDVQATIADIASTIAAFEPVTLLADASLHAEIQRRTRSDVQLWDVPTEDLWARDAGPLFAKSGSDTVISHIQFNGWGSKQVHRHDAQVATAVARRLGLPLVDAGLKGEPGGVDHDGHGSLIAHESSWLIENRNPGLSRDEIGARLKEAYGADRLTWARGVYDQDITDYHIDSLARFAGPGRILMNLPDAPDPRDPFHRAALETHDALAAEYNVEVIPEPVQRRVRDPEFVASYVNYYACNGAVISAQFGDPDADAIAAKALARHYPGREIVTLNTDALGELGGGIHCATQQMPA
ncbi:Agmatine deiminase [Candidatus Rhodobacter oscarellae]|uniref:Agmatine deiminase n=1 Tax=Candidatus Rhodobacter oscarellae TaxID=1675527 RepID=A0A0J9E6W5_9RHOB|nr:agmatine deiminase family protein [Candidatus Rhodobacter lobularis]KMW57554.1 Agmatine deiminase [Candidatus Rhodobacter lobularis]